MLDATNQSNLPPPSPWTDERIELLKRMLADGDSATEIASAIGNGMTRNSVLGKIHRLGLSGEMQAIWTEGRTARLIKLWCDGRSYRQIAAELGLSRNTVMGKGTRLRLSELHPRASRPAVLKRSKSRANNDRSATQRIAKKLRVRSESNGGVMIVDSVVREEAPQPPEFLGVTFLDLEPGQCKFPRGEGADIRFCGQPQMSGEPYCRNCCSIAFTYTPPPSSRPYLPHGRAKPAVF